MWSSISFATCSLGEDWQEGELLWVTEEQLMERVGSSLQEAPSRHSCETMSGNIILTFLKQCYVPGNCVYAFYVCPEDRHFDF